MKVRQIGRKNETTKEKKQESGHEQRIEERNKVRKENKERTK